ncbi:MAG: PAS domain-containing protein [Desulfatiglandaceae bacterium]
MEGNKVTYPCSKFALSAAILLLLILNSLHAFAMADGRIVKVGVYENAPKIFISESGKPAGIFIDLIEHIAKSERWQLRYVPGTWGEGLNRLEKGEIDLMPDVSYSADREKIFAFHKEPVLSDWFQVYARKGSGIKSIVDLTGKRIVVLERSVQQAAFERLTKDFGFDSTLIPLPNYKTIFERVAAGDADAAVTNRFNGTMYAQAFDLEDTAIIFNPTKLFFAAHKGIHENLLNAIDAHIIELKKDPDSAYFQTLEHWTSEKFTFALPDWVKIVGIIAGTVLLMSLAGSLILKQQVNVRTRELQQKNREMEKEIQARKEAEKNLWVSTNRLQLALASSNIGLWDWDLETNDVWFSPEWKRHIGYDDHEISNRYEEWEKRLHPEDRPSVIAQIEAYLQGRVRAYDVEFRLAHKDGSYRWINASGGLVFESERKARRFIGSQIDITERRKSEKALREAYDIINRSSSVAFTWNNREGWPVEFVSENVGRIFGYTVEEFKSGKVDYFQCVHPDDIKRVAAEVNDASSKEDISEFIHEPYRIIAKDGSERIVNDRTYIMRSHDGRVTQYKGIVEDITRQKLAEEERKHLEDQLRQAQKLEAVGRLTSGIAHDFNNLLTTIIGNAEMAIMDMDTNTTLCEIMEEIKEAGNRASALTHQLLAFSRKQIIQPEVVNINDPIHEMDKMLRRIIGEDIELETLLGPDLSSVEVDVSQLEQVIMNLAVNARDAMPRGGKLTIETKNVELDEDYARHHIAMASGSYVMLAVSDTGMGISKEIQGQIFEPFFTTKGKGKGTGLGLSTVYGIVKQNNGNIWVYSEPDQGTTFKVYLPVAAMIVSGIRSPKKQEPKDLFGSETILLVEDDQSLRKLATRTLEKYGYTVMAAADGREALRMFEEHKDPIHLMVTDVIMPGMSGKELANFIKDMMPELKVLFMSGYTDNAIVHHGVLEKGIAFLQKPFTPERLARKVREVLEKRNDE